MQRHFHALSLAIALSSATSAHAGECKLSTYSTLPVEMTGLRPTVMAKVNGKDSRFIVDTGAFFGTMSRANAAELGLKLEPAPYGLRGEGVGGSFDMMVATVKSFGILDGTIPKLQFTVGGTDMGMPLLGANLLLIGDLDIDLAKGKARLFKPKDCGKYAMAYWTNGSPYEVANLEQSRGPYDKRTFLKVSINGKPVRALLDTGAPTTVLTREAAQRAGIDLTAPGVRESSAVGGFGRKSYRSWIARIDSFSIGTETIRNSQMQIMDGDFGSGDGVPEMLLGVDFYLAHHLYIANSQRKLYFTYNGGRVFSLAAAPRQKDDQAGTAAPDSKQASAAALSPADLFLRGQASLSRGETKAALADLDAAIAGDGAKPGYYLARAQARLADRQMAAALADLDKVIALDGDHVEALLRRAALHATLRNREKAEADIAAARAQAPAGSHQSLIVARYLISAERLTEALPILDKWVALHPDDSMLDEVLSERCLARVLANVALTEALADCRKALRRDGTKPAYRENLGLAQLRLGLNAEAAKTLEIASAAMPSSAKARYALGTARIRLGQQEAGMADQAAARAIDPMIDVRFSRFGL